MSSNTTFLQALRLPPDLTDKACPHSIFELISRATREESPTLSLKEIHEAVSRYDCAAYLEPLDVLPLLLPCRQEGATNLSLLCALHNSPKEVLIVIQEEIEYVRSRFNEEQEEQENGSDLVQRTIGVVSLCAPAISRLKVGKRSELEICYSVLDNVASLMSSVSPLATKEEGRTLITEVARLVQSSAVWVSAVPDVNELQKIKNNLRELLDMTVASCASSIQVSLAVRAAESYFPRFFVKSTEKEWWKDGEGAMRQVQLALEHLGDYSQTAYRPTSFGDLMYMAHSTPPIALIPSALTDLYPLLINALQMNMAVDESLFLLIRILMSKNMGISPDVATSMCTVFTALASTHLDSRIRQLNLRLLSLTLTKLPPGPRLAMLFKLTTDEDFPQIRGPAVGLLKEAVIEALELPQDHESRDVFASPDILHMFASVLFRPNPPDFFSQRKTKEELAQSLELLRIADCLSFYYVLLLRDRENKTGVRSKGNVMGVQGSILEPLRQFLDEHVDENEQPSMAMTSLRVGLHRIDGALQALDLETETDSTAY